ncbi:MAG: GDP-L-fucose synthase [Fuerstiella sp.]|nr:GDP-L-fucose synthase [Fuerstiella sp.]
MRQLKADGFTSPIVASHSELDLICQSATNDFFQQYQPEIVVFAASRVGGIHANSMAPAEFIYQNLAMATNAIHAAWKCGTQRFLFLGSTCVYPRLAPQPIPESALLTSALEPTNEAYAIAKIAGLKMCRFYREQYGVTYHSAMPTNLYGPGDNYHPENSHVLPAMIRRFHEAKEVGVPSVTIWGSGKPLREFLHVTDIAEGILHLLSLNEPPDLVNIGTGKEVSIRQLAELVAEIVGYRGSITTDTSKPDGTPRKLSDVRLIQSTGWFPKIGLRDGISSAYTAFLNELSQQALRSV